MVNGEAGSGSDEIDDMTRFVSPAERAGGLGSQSSYLEPAYQPAPVPPQAYQPPAYPQQYPQPSPPPYPPQKFPPPAYGGVPSPTGDFQPGFGPRSPAAAPAPGSGSGSKFGAFLLALTLLTAFFLAVADIVAGGDVSSWWAEQLMGMGVASDWFASLDCVVLVVGLLCSALASCRTGSRAPGVLLCWLLLVTSVYSTMIALKLGIIDTYLVSRTAASVVSGVSVVFAAAMWLVAKRRNLRAVWLALIGFPMGAGAHWIHFELWAHNVFPNPDWQREDWAWSAYVAGSLWSLILAAVVTVWLGVLADRMISPKPPRTTAFAPPTDAWS